MPKNLRFWRNVILIAAAHVVAVVALARWSGKNKTAVAQSVVWMSGGAGYGAMPPAATASPLKALKSPAVPEPQPKPKEEADIDQPVLAPVKSEIQLPAQTPTPAPTATPTPRPRSTSTPAPSPKVKVTPKPTPKATPKPTPKPTPRPSPKKLVVAKASPKPKPSPQVTADDDEDVDSAAKEAAPVKTAEASPSEKPKSVAAQSPNAKPGSGGSGGHGAGATIQSQFGWYGSMLHDRFYSEWAQPSSLGPNAKASALVKIRIEQDGRVSSFEIVKSSGNAAVDASITAAAKRVTKVDPLPAGLGNGEHYDVKINFELNSD